MGEVGEQGPQFHAEAGRHAAQRGIEHVLALVGPRAQKQSVSRETRLAAHSLLACDREQIIQVFLNLVINALQHMPSGGLLRIGSQEEAAGLRLRVEDSGPGIPEAEVARVFDPFYTRREGGVGLGLTIVQQIVHAHGGEIEVGRSELGGAAFTLRFAAPAC